MPCVRCQTTENGLCRDKTGIIIGDVHLERIEMAYRFYSEFFNKDGDADE